MFSVACKNIVLSFLLVDFLFPESRTEYHAEKKGKRNVRRTTEKEIKVKLIFQYSFWSTGYEFLKW